MVNADLDDLVNDANAARPLTAGGTGGTSQITGWDGLTAQGTAVPSASTIVLDTVTGPWIDISGTTTITAVTLGNGKIRLARATGAFQLTASASLIVNNSTSVNYTTTAGDFLIFTAEGGVVRVSAVGSSPAATTSTAGTVKLATNAQAEVGTDTAAALTSSNLAALLNAGTDNSGGATITMGDGGYFNLITSTTAITAFAFTNDAVGRTARIRFNTVRTLTYNATSLILPGAANITTAVGDIMQIRSLGSGNFVVEWYSRAGAPAAITLGSTVASTSGTAIDYTSLPAGIRRLSVHFNGTSLSGTAHLLIEIGDSGGIETTGYVSSSSTAGGTNAVASTQSTAGFIIYDGTAANAVNGSVILSLVDGSATWAAFGSVSVGTGFVSGTGGTKALSPGPLDRVRITTTNGTDTFDAGTVNISYEF